MTPHEQVLSESGMFTQVEPEWLAEVEHASTWVNTSRGVVVKVRRAHGKDAADARLFYDVAQDTYASSGWYTPDELRNWLLPVMRSDRAWDAHCDNVRAGHGDLTLALELA
jgi:hypothetical protein